MIAKTLVLVSAVFGLVSGSCFEIRCPQECSAPQFVSIPVQTESCFSAPIVSDCLCSSGSSDIISSPCSASIVCDHSCAPVSSSPVFSCSSIDTSCGSSFSIPVFSSGNSFSDVFSSSGSSSGSSSSGLQPGNGPEGDSYPAIQAPPVTLPVVESPPITLSSPPIPAPRVLSQRCVCTKTVVKPQIVQREVTIPRLQRYLKRTYTPVVENVAYKSTPISHGSSSSSGSSSSVVFSSDSGSLYGSCSSQKYAPVVLPSESVSCGSSSVCSPVVVSSGSSCAKYC